MAVNLRRDVVLPLATLLLGAVATYVVGRVQAREASDRTAREQRRAFYQRLQSHLDGAWASFQNQATARDRLVALLEHRLGPLPVMEYEPLFRRYHASFNEEEAFLCRLMRGITLTALRQHNEALNTLLQDNPQYSAEIPESRALAEHLDLWLSKAAAMKDRPEVCLVYIGVEEKKPFPSDVSKSVARILEGF